MSRALIVLIAIAAIANRSSAALISGGELLSQDYADQIESWLDEGSVKFTNIFSKQAGADSISFHDAVDGKGRTITVIEVLEGVGYEGWGTDSFGFSEISAQVIGGYNPQSWLSSTGDGFFANWRMTVDHVDRTAFVFNLTTGELHRQLLDGDGDVTAGAYQTYNRSDYGPSFGNGHDIFLDRSLTYGFAFNYSYGATRFDSIIKSPNNGYYVELFNQIGKVETYTISSATTTATPEPASLALFGIGGLGLLVAPRRRRRHC